MKSKLIFLTILFCTFGCFASVFDPIKLELEKQFPSPKRQIDDDVCILMKCGKKDAACLGGNIPAVCKSCFQTFDVCDSEAPDDETRCDCLTELSRCVLTSNNDVCKFMLDSNLDRLCDTCSCTKPSQISLPLCNNQYYCESASSKCIERYQNF